jgi:hypothetical protein
VLVMAKKQLRQQQQCWMIFAVLCAAPHLSVPQGQTQVQGTQPALLLLLLLLLLGALLHLQTHWQQQEIQRYQTNCCPQHLQGKPAAPAALRLHVKLHQQQQQQQHCQTQAQAVTQRAPHHLLLLLLLLLA